MLLYIHNLPPHTTHRDIENLIAAKCGISSIILDNLVTKGSGLRVTVGLIDEADAAIVMKNINGLFLGEFQLFVEDVRKNLTSHKNYKSSQSRLQKEYQLFVEDVCKKSTSDEPYTSSQIRLQNSSTLSNYNNSSNDLSFKTSSSAMPLSTSGLREQMYYSPPTYNAPNNQVDQARHLLSQTQALDTSLSHLEQNSMQQQKSQYELNTVSSTNHDFENYLRDLQMCSSNYDRYFHLVDSQAIHKNDKARVSRTESKKSKGCVLEERHRLERSRSSHYNAAPPKVIDLRNYSRHDEPYRKGNKDSRLMSRVLKRRISPSDFQLHKSKYPREESLAVSSTTQNLSRKSLPSRKYEDSRSQGSFRNSSHRSSVAEKVLPNLTHIQQPILMADLNKTIHNLANNMFFVGERQVSLPNTSQLITSAKFNGTKQESNISGLSKENTNKPVISPWDPKFVQFENMNFKKKETSKPPMSLQKLFNKGETYRFTAVARIVKEFNFGDYIKIWVPGETKAVDSVKFRQIYLKELKAEVLRRINEMLKDELLVPIDTIIERYKNKYDLINDKQMFKLINNRVNKKFAKEHKASMVNCDTSNTALKVQNMQKHSDKKIDKEPKKGISVQQTNRLYQQLVQQDKPESHEARAEKNAPIRPKWFCDMMSAASSLLSRSRRAKMPEKKILFTMKAVLSAELAYYKEMAYEMDEAAQNDTLTLHLKNYKYYKQNLIVIAPIESSDLPDFRPLCDFLQLYDVVGLRKFTVKNIYLVLLSKENCKGLHALGKTSVDGKMVTFVPIIQANHLCPTPVRYRNTTRRTKRNIRNGNTDGEKKIKSGHPVELNSNTLDEKTECVRNGTKVVNDNLPSQSAAEEQTKINEAVAKDRSAVIKTSENVTQNPTKHIIEHTNIQKGASTIYDNSESTPKVLEELGVLKANVKPSVDIEIINHIDMLPDDLLSDDEIEVCVDDLEDY